MSEGAGEPLVLGAELAAARAAQVRHEAQPRGESPLAGVGYDPAGQKLGWLHFTVVAADEVIDGFADRFAACDQAERQRQRDALTMSDFYTILSYAGRAAIRAIRSGDAAAIRRGIVALAAVDVDRVDWRDLAWQAGLLRYAAGRVGAGLAGAGLAGICSQAALLAAGPAAEFIAGLADRPAARLSDWGIREVATSAGVGFVEDDGARYRPRRDLVALAQAVAAGLSDGTWRLSDPVTGARLPPFWLGAGPAEATAAALRSVTGCVILRGELADQSGPGAGGQHLLVFLAEVRNPAAAVAIASAAGPAAGHEFVAVATASGSVCAVLAARSFVQEVPALETAESIERFRQPLADALATALATALAGLDGR